MDIKIIKKYLLIICFILIGGCAAVLQDTIFKPLSNDSYIKYYRPLVTTTIIIYKDGISSKNFIYLSQLINEMDKQSADKEDVDIYQSLLVLLDPILKDEKKNSVPKEEAQSALFSLEIINKIYKKSPLIKEIYPRLKKVLQTNVVIQKT